MSRQWSYGLNIQALNCFWLRCHGAIKAKPCVIEWFGIASMAPWQWSGLVASLLFKISIPRDGVQICFRWLKSQICCIKRYSANAMTANGSISTWNQYSQLLVRCVHLFFCIRKVRKSMSSFFMPIFSKNNFTRICTELHRLWKGWCTQTILTSPTRPNQLGSIEIDSIELDRLLFLIWL